VRNAVVAREDDERRPRDRGPRGALDHADLARQRFEAPEAAGRLGARVDEMLKPVAQRLVERLDDG
jgi:hypothetical protein